LNCCSYSFMFTNSDCRVFSEHPLLYSLPVTSLV
jgi:hypothetical protein